MGLTTYDARCYLLFVLVADAVSSLYFEFRVGKMDIIDVLKLITFPGPLIHCSLLAGERYGKRARLDCGTNNFALLV
eukprot:4797773-Pleurochrysis_carterae.AAC.3